MRYTKRLPNGLSGCLVCLLLCAIIPVLYAQKTPAQKRTVASSGQQIFASSCAGCHGLDGRGGERAPNIAANAKVQRMSDQQVFRIVSDGIAGTGMPAFHSLSDAERHAVIKHLRVLQGQQPTSALPGNPLAGNSVFFGKGGCSSCHMVAGRGGFLGSDLTTYAREKSSEQLLQVITDPASVPGGGNRLAIATMRDGRKFEGIVRNQDNFSVQLQAIDGTFHFLQRSDIVRLEHSSASLMPNDYEERLSRRELNDLISYLMDVARSRKTIPAVHEEN
jgi:cytochrome c oxidase cbb3-type subunit 3